uniref:Uncharacterized protein n=1 Tax=Arundo donax TaxID=35708 RepID=A0A0A9BD47_ARUDO
MFRTKSRIAYIRISRRYRCSIHRALEELFVKQ